MGRSNAAASNAAASDPELTAEPTVAQILKRNAGQYVSRYLRQAAPQVQSTLAKLSLCQTSALGGRKYRCGGCEATSIVYNSCGDRYCPTCSGARRSNWLDSTGELILDGVDHFQVVFTLPGELSSLALGNRKAIYDLLFTSSWQALRHTIAAEHGYEAAAVMVLHTWNQKLDAHAHVHAVVPACGPALSSALSSEQESEQDGSGIRYAQREGDSQTRGKYLVDAETLRTNFREAFLPGLDRLRRSGELKLAGSFESLQNEAGWKTFRRKLQGMDWVSHIQPPPRAGLTGQHVLKYLAGYLSGGPIANSRIVSTDGQTVTFMAHAGEVAGGQSKQVPITMSQVEFTRRWCLHVLPSGYTRTRRFGGWANVHRERFVERLAILLEAEDAPLSEEATEFGPFEDGPSDDSSADQEPGPSAEPLCQVCGGSLIPHSEIPKPGWACVMHSRHRPSWYHPP